MKTTQEQFKSGQDIYQSIINEALVNEKFKQELIASPKSTIEKFIGKKTEMPESTSFVVEDQSDSSVIYLNIPQKVSADDIELTEEQLEMASGGIIVTAIVVAVACGAAGFTTCALLDKYF